MNEKIYWQEQTQKALDNFGKKMMPREWIRAFGEVKKAALQAAFKAKGVRDLKKERAVLCAIDEIVQGLWDNQFMVPLEQGSAGTSINMNFNEVISTLANEKYKRINGLEILIDPLEDVNQYQSTNDLLATAITVYVYRQIVEVEEAVILLQEKLVYQEKALAGIMITGRTELQNALPITLGQVFGGWAGALERNRWQLNKLKERVRTIALGGTAMGTSYGIPREYIFQAEILLRDITGLPLSRSQNLVDEISNMDKLAEVAAGFQLLALNLSKISSDLLLYTSSLSGEISHPKLQYGSSIMPAKSNPVILELVKGLALEVQGECHKINLFCQNGQLQLNSFGPFVVQSFTRIHRSLIKALSVFIEKFIDKFTINNDQIEKNLLNSGVMLNLLLPRLGYHRIKELYRELEEKPITSLKELKIFISQNTLISLEELEDYFHPQKATSLLSGGRL
ncbi:MAG: fumarate lyase [Spirochaetales bacterium]|nr:fumarate lyase [Spirochaetales bacterium]